MGETIEKVFPQPMEPDKGTSEWNWMEGIAKVQEGMDAQ